MEPNKKRSDPAATLSTLNEFYAQGKYSDVKIKIGSATFPCQRSVLAAISNYFDTMFLSDFKEKEADTIVVKGIDSSAFREILQLMFTGQIRITDLNVHSLLVANDFLQLRNRSVEDQCFEYLQEKMRSSVQPFLNTIKILLFSHATKKERFVQLLSAHVSKHLMHFVEDTGLMEIPFELLIAILSECRNHDSKDLERYRRGNACFRVIICWLGYSCEDRSQYRNELMNYIDTSNLSTDYALSLMNNFVDQVVKHDIKVASRKTSSVKSMAAFDPRRPMAYAMGTTIIIHAQNFSRTGPNFQLNSSRSLHGAEFSVFIIGSGSADLCIRIQPNSSGYYHYNNRTSGHFSLLKVCFSIVSQKEGKEDLIKYFQVDASQLNYRYDHSLKSVGYDYLVQEKNGYIKNDRVTFQLRLSFL